MAPATAAERKRKSRANRSEEQKLKEREKAKSHMRELRLKRKNDRKWKRKENDASKLRMRKMRAKKNLQTSLVMPSENPFKSPQSFGKALKRTRTALPQSPRKKLAVVKKMAKDLGIPIAETNENETKKKGISDDVKIIVKEFYYRDEISRQLPGKKDVKSFKDPVSNQKVILQKRLLSYNLKEAYEIFKADNPGTVIGFSKFCDFRPVEVDTIGSKDHEVCCCPYCENINFLVQACKWKNSNIKTIHELLAIIVCDMKSDDCMKHKCEKCSLLFGEIILQEAIPKSGQIIVPQWVGGQLEQKTFEFEMLLKELSKQILKVSEHVYNITRQATELRKQKDNLQPNEILIQTDFAQNYQIKHQNEVMAAHWKTDQDPTVTIYTAVFYYRRDENDDLICQTYGVISDTKKHTSFEVKVFNDCLIEDFEKSFDLKVKKAIIWSDGAAAHFKNRYSIGLMSSSDIFSEWNFCESYHGKGPHDGVGAVLKRHVWKKVLQKQIIVNNAYDFYREVNSAPLNVKCLYVPEDAIQIQIPEMKKFFGTLKPLKGIKLAHSISKVSLFCVNMYINTGDILPYAQNINCKNKNCKKLNH